jgi:hypothetical protein
MSPSLLPAPDPGSSFPPMSMQAIPARRFVLKLSLAEPTSFLLDLD